MINNNQDLDHYLKIIKCFSGVFGWYPSMEPYIPDKMRHLFHRRAYEYKEKDFKEFVVEMRRINQEREYDYTKWEREHPGRIPVYHQGYQGEIPYSREELEKVIDSNRSGLGLEHIPSSLSLEDIETIRNFAIRIGFTQSEVDELIQWQIRPLSSHEEDALAELVKTILNKQFDKRYEKEEMQVYRTYTAVMSVHPMARRFGKNHSNLPPEHTDPYLQKVAERIIWQITELEYFISIVFFYLPLRLENEPVQISSGKYDETPKRELTQSEMIIQMSQELITLPRFSAYAKVLQENNNKQVVVKKKIETYPLVSLSKRQHADEYSEPMRTIIEQNTVRAGYCIPREDIEVEIRERQERWQRGEDPGESPARQRRKPPPTSEDPPAMRDKTAPDTDIPVTGQPRPPQARSSPRPLGIQLEMLTFYESGADRLPLAQCQFSTRFSQRAARYIGYVLWVKNLQRQHDQTFQLTARYYYADGRLLGESRQDTACKSEWEDSVGSAAMGWAEPGEWKLGTYRVKILIDEVEFAEGSFTIE